MYLKLKLCRCFQAKVYTAKRYGSFHRYLRGPSLRSGRILSFGTRKLVYCMSSLQDRQCTGSLASSPVFLLVTSISGAADSGTTNSALVFSSSSQAPLSSPAVLVPLVLPTDFRACFLPFVPGSALIPCSCCLRRTTSLARQEAWSQIPHSS